MHRDRTRGPQGVFWGGFGLAPFWRQKKPRKKAFLKSGQVLKGS